ncbi:uncharacterized protein N7496_012074 [Penicillium cataractarum]|uniref:Cation transporter n=1 Tax=Penicillium cataractarum TaxID=2100454 RepID=A0A9W9RGE2_9EURO|nr:uncharacterized protein N7496_012074 [Penicillium cataractarum]KAJ5359661.1 hypothetical protein N7496_012074 [Penicillium cataractarum]
MASILKSRLLLLHCTYLFLMSMIGSVILYTKSTQISDLQYVDALFMSFSAMTGTGLTVLDLSTLNGLQQGILLTLLILGHAIPINTVISFLRALTLRSALKDNSNKNKLWQDMIHKPVIHLQEKQTDKDHYTAILTKILTPLRTHITGREIHADIPSPSEPDVSRDTRHFIIVTDQSYPHLTRQSQSINNSGHRRRVGGLKTCSSWLIVRLKGMWLRIKDLAHWNGSIDPNEPGWVEYQALIILSVLTILYAIVFLFVGILSIGLWMSLSRPDIPQADGVSPLWAGAFLATSSFVNNGMSLIDANMAPFQLEPAPLLICGFLILTGNTLFPCILRLVIWTIRKMLPDKTRWRPWQRPFDLILTQPQRVCTFLYPAIHTWFLLGTVLVLNGIMWGSFELASVRSSKIATLPFKFRVLDGLFQSSAVRGGGFSVVTFEKLPQGLLTIYPAAVLRSRNSDENELKKIPCIEAGKSDCSSPLSGSKNSILARGQSYIQHFRVHLSYDVWWLSLAVLIVCVAESDHYDSQPLAFSTFNIIFEVVSAYSYVGVSVGYPGKNYSFCGEWTPFSKVLLIFISFIGRHRDLFASIGNSTWLTGFGEVADEDMKLQEKDAEHISSATVRLY